MAPHVIGLANGTRLECLVSQQRIKQRRFARARLTEHDGDPSFRHQSLYGLDTKIDTLLGTDR